MSYLIFASLDDKGKTFIGSLIIIGIVGVLCFGLLCYIKDKILKK